MKAKTTCPFRGLLLTYPKTWQRCELAPGHDGDHQTTVGDTKRTCPK